MYYFSTKYHLLIVEVSEVFELIESFILTKKEDIFDLVKALKPHQYVIAGVMQVSKSQKMVWVEDYDVAGRDINLEDLFDFIYDSLNYFDDEFQSEWC